MPVSNGLNPTFDQINIGNSGTTTSVSQATSTVTAVTVNAKAGVISLYAPQNLAAGAEISFTVNNDKVDSNSVVLVSLKDAGSVGGTPVAFAKPATGSFAFVLTNLHASVAETGTLTATFAVLN